MAGLHPLNVAGRCLSGSSSPIPEPSTSYVAQRAPLLQPPTARAVAFGRWSQNGVVCQSGRSNRRVQAVALEGRPSAGFPFPRKAFDQALRSRALDRYVDMVSDARRQKARLPTLDFADFFNACVRQKRMDLAYRFAEEMPPRETIYSMLLGACGKTRDFGTAVRAFKLWQANFEPNEWAFTGLISAAGKSGRLDAARLGYADAQRLGFLTPGVFNAYLDACGRGGAHEEIPRVRAAMAEAGVRPDVVTFNTLMNAASSRGDFTELEALRAEMRGLGVNPTVFTYGILMNAASKAKGRLGWALEVYAEMKERGVRCNNYVLSSLLKVCAAGGEEGAAGFEIFDELVALGHRPNTIAFTSLVGVCQCTRQHVRAIRLLDEMDEAGCPPNTVTYSAVLIVLERTGGWEYAKAVWKRMEEANVRPNIQTYNVMLQCLAKDGSLRSAERWFEKLHQEGLVPDVVTYNSMILACTVRKDSERALEYCDRMEAAGVAPSVETMQSAVHACARRGRVEDAILTVSRYQRAGIKPTVEVYTSLMYAHGKSRRKESLDHAFGVFEAMKAAGCEPTVVTYGCLLDCCRRVADPDRARRVYAEMVAHGHVPTDDIHNLLIKTCAESGEVDRALEIVKDVVGDRGEVQGGAFNSLLRALVRSGHVDRGLRVKSLMETRGMAASRTAVTGLVEGCCRMGRPVEGYTLYKAMRRRGNPPARKAASLLVATLCRGEQLERASWVYDDLESVGLTAFPSSVCALVHATARAGDLPRALQMYHAVMAVARGPKAAVKHPGMFESLLEACLHTPRQAAGEGGEGDELVEQALRIFDDMREADAHWGASGQHQVRISTATLAFLEARVRNVGVSCPDLEWRLYDVLSYIRIRRESTAETHRDSTAPSKSCHHVGATPPSTAGGAPTWRLLPGEDPPPGPPGGHGLPEAPVSAGGMRDREPLDLSRAERNLWNNIGPYHRARADGSVTRARGFGFYEDPAIDGEDGGGGDDGEADFEEGEVDDFYWEGDEEVEDRMITYYERSSEDGEPSDGGEYGGR